MTRINLKTFFLPFSVLTKRSIIQRYDFLRGQKKLLRNGERIDQLYAEDIQIIQSSEVFSFSIDAVLLANFARVPKRGKIIDLCAGNGAIGLF